MIKMAKKAKAKAPAKKAKGPAFGSPEWRKKHGLPLAKKGAAKKKAK